MKSLKKSWKDKYDNACKDLPKIEVIEGKMIKRWGEGTCLIPSPKELETVMRQIPEGKIITGKEIREILAKSFNASITCPLTSGIFTWIVANTAEELALLGQKSITPWWRTLKSDGVLNEKYPGGIEYQKKLLEHEGHVIIKKGKNYIVKDFNNKIFTAIK